jgi:hypothetical protein
VGADLDRAAWLDQALGTLAGHRRRPQAYAVVVDSSSVELLLAPAESDPPGVWQPVDGGRRWRLERTSLSADTTPSGGPSFPGLVSIGRDESGRDVLLDLEAAAGPVTVVGDPVQVGRVITALAVELATNLWSRGVRVITTGGMPTALGQIVPNRLCYQPDLISAVGDFEQHNDEPGGGEVLTGSVLSDGTPAVPDYLIVGSTPPPDLADRLEALTRTNRQRRVGVVTAGEMQSARWRLVVDQAGTLEVADLGLRVRANGISEPALRSVRELVSPDAGDVVPDRRRERVPLPLPHWQGDDAAFATAVARVLVLGEPEVRTAVGSAGIDPSLVDLATEIVAYLALTPGGAFTDTLATAIWPHGVYGATRDATMARVRDWLGNGSNGLPHLRLGDDGRYELGPEVATDWDCVCTLLAQSRAANDPKDEIDLLRRALRLARGPLLAGRPPRTYAWIVRTERREIVTDVIIDASHRLAILQDAEGDPEAAAAAARTGLRVAPLAGTLWEDLLVSVHASGGVGALNAEVARMHAAYAEHGNGVPDTEVLMLADSLRAIRRSRFPSADV